ncbi:carbohydrate ABC transporter membrane protein 1, CUT1 family (TC 3.A.1.1.-) [Atopostipes suicloacalis DSM 15692]|uniref:Carbohydrate ABC transporter membrane protein 1, CUT1 family (TC 3.A.1.1.-) n=2 Tax=Atopostipes suicloacalis TaxID=180295 RepID=A0A1M4Z951_9LACT|nr:carbohydrate ABC transporter membrane protein 1, CUT1 family (TC 3.A.1.1.-) [Atopostipes suicloacalis DSM 15692]
MSIQSRAKSKNISHGNREKRSMMFWGWMLIAPTLIGLLILNIIPVIQTLIMSFQNVSTFGESTWVFFDNYKRLFEDPKFWLSLKNTLLYGIIQVPITVALSTLAAVLLNQKIKGVEVYRVIYFLPMIAAPAAVAMVWRWMYSSDYGLINSFLKFLGFSGNIEWLYNPQVVIWSLIIVGIWSNVGYNMILLLSGLQEIPKSYYEAADLDGAGTVQQFFKITLPLLTPQLFFVLVTSIISAFQVFDLIFVMFEATNPALSKVQSLVYQFYNETFILDDKGYGAAIVIILVVLIMIVTVIQLIGQKKWVNYD